MAYLIFVTGGARSGKSDYALNRAEMLPGPHTFVATCPVVDLEMADRITRHKLERQNGMWSTIEEEIDLVAAIKRLAPGSVCLVDCLTLWINNLLYVAEKMGYSFGEDEMQLRTTEFVEAVGSFQGTVICVSNEVGLGVVPDNAAARKYCDLVGRSNRIVVASAQEAVFVSCGLPLFLKGQLQEK